MDQSLVSQGSMPDSRGSVGLGLQGDVSKNLTMFASGDYNFELGGDGNFDSWSGRIGMKVKW